MAYLNPCNAYEHAKQTKNYYEQIIMLYEGAITSVMQAKEAHKNADHALRYELIDKAIKIIRGLFSCLDFDKAPEVANALAKHYESIEILLVSIQGEDNKEELCDKVIDNLRIIKDAWVEANNTAKKVSF